MKFDKNLLHVSGSDTRGLMEKLAAAFRNRSAKAPIDMSAIPHTISMFNAHDNKTRYHYARPDYYDWHS